MTKPKWTKGPWVLGEGTCISHKHRGANDNWIICETRGPDSKYNRRLIAQAPEMAKELSSVVLTLDRLAQNWPLADMVSVVKELADHRATILAILTKIEDE